jgi:hypothetical protein
MPLRANRAILVVKGRINVRITAVKEVILTIKSSKVGGLIFKNTSWVIVTIITRIECLFVSNC